MFIESLMPSNHLILCHPLLLLPSIFPSIRVSANELSFHIRQPKYWRFSFSISSSSREYSGLISFRIEWLIFLLSKRFSRVFFSITVQKHQFFGTQPSLRFTSIYDYWKNQSFNYMELCQQSDVLCFLICFLRFIKLQINTKL